MRACKNEIHAGKISLLLSVCFCCYAADPTVTQLPNHTDQRSELSLQSENGVRGVKNISNFALPAPVNLYWVVCPDLVGKCLPSLKDCGVRVFADFSQRPETERLEVKIILVFEIWLNRSTSRRAETMVDGLPRAYRFEIVIERLCSFEHVALKHLG